MRGSTRWVAALLGLHLLIGLLYDWATPVFEASDEGAHYAVVRWLATGHSLPVQRPHGPTQPWEQEGSQPPLYYMLVAGFTAWVDTSDFEQVFVHNPLSRVGVPGTTHNVNLFRHPLTAPPLTGTQLAVHIARWFSLALSAVTVLLTWRLARAVFPGRELLALLAAALVAFNPMALFINASVNNDNLLMLLSTASLLVAVSLMRPDVKGSLWKAAGLGLLLGLAALTKVSGLVLWPVALLGVGWGEYRRRRTEDGGRKAFVRLAQPSFVLRLALVFGIALLVCGWWFWRNYTLYGEWLGLNTMVAIAGPRIPPITLDQLIREEWRGFFLSYWSVFGVFTILPARWVLYFYSALTLWALLGGLWALIKDRPRPKPELLLLGFFCLLTLVGVIRWTLQTSASQGRLMFGAIAPLSIFMAAGILAPLKEIRDGNPRSAAERGRRVEIGIWVLGACAGILPLVAAIIPIAYIAPRYAPPPRLAETELPDNIRTVGVRFGEVMELIGYTADEAPRKPGESLPVTLYWRALKSMDNDYALALHLLGRGAVEVGKLDTWPGGGNLPTSQWRPGEVFADPYLVPIDARAEAPTQLRLAVDVWDRDPYKTLPAITPNDENLGTVYLTVGRVIPVQAPTFSPAIVEGSTFEHGIKLLGVEASADGVLYLVLYWQTGQPVPGDYTVFLHLLDSGGLVILQADAPPLNEDWPTSAWVPGQPFADARLIALPPNLPAGRYTLRLGFYDPDSGARLTAYRADGTQWQNNMVIIENLIEIK